MRKYQLRLCRQCNKTFWVKLMMEAVGFATYMQCQYCSVSAKRLGYRGF